MAFLKLVTICIFLTSCGSQLDYLVGGRGLEDPQVDGFEITGVLKDINGNSYNLSKTEKPRIIIFAATFCSVCQREHRNLRDLMMQNQNQLPDNVDILTIMVDALDSTDSLEFQDLTKIQWSPYYQIDNELKNILCGENAGTPCIVVEKPNVGVVFKHVGGVSIEELQSITGVWKW